MVKFSRACLALFIAVALAGCKASGGAQAEDENSPAAQARVEVLRDVGARAVLPAIDQFVVDAKAMQVAVDTWRQSGSADDRTAAAATWRAAMSSWERIELMRFGPTGAMGIDVGGMDFRDLIYSWPTTNACRVDQELVAQSYDDPTAYASLAVNVQGMDALEYLLFFEDPTNQCDAARGINTDGSWAALSPDEITTRRAAFASATSALVVERAEALRTAWAAFADDLAISGRGGQNFASSREALNVVSDALFHVDTDLKDLKLAEPAGLLNCATATCPQAREFLWEDHNFAAVVANLEGFEMLFTGGDGRGFDDLLDDVGQGPLSDEILAASQAAREAAQTATPMATTLPDDPAPIVEVHAKVKTLTDLLKTQFISVLDLELPDRAEGDND